MSLGTCIPGMIKRGEIDVVRAKRMADLFDELERFYRRSMGPEAAAAEASEATLKQLAGEARLKKRQTLLQVNRVRAAVKDIESFKGASTFDAIGALLDDHDQAPYRGGNVTTLTTIIENGSHRRIADFIDRHRRNLLGKPQDPAGLDDVGRELFGEKTGNARAEVFARAIEEDREQSRQRFNAAGGNIRKLDSYGVKQRWDPLKAREVSAEAFTEAMLPELDRARMIDDRTGVPFTDDALRAVLGDVHETIRTNGLTGEPSAGFGGGGKLANRHQEHRFLHFKDFDSWRRVNTAFGTNDNLFTIVMDEVSSRAKETAMMERLGPNPEAAFRYLISYAKTAEAKSDKVRAPSVMGKSAGEWKAETLWRYIKGDSNVPVVPDGAVGYYAVRTLQGARNLATARKLGSAVISAASGDMATSAASRRIYGLSAISEVNNGLMAHALRQVPDVKLFVDRLKLLNPADASHRKLAVELNAGMQDAAHSLSALVRLHGDASGPGWTNVAADGVLRMTGLNRVTKAAQDVAYLDAMRTLGSYRETGWKALPEELRTAMEGSGIAEADWTAARHAAPLMFRGLPHIDPKAITDRGAADRIAGYALRYQASSVQESTPTVRAAMTLGTSAGTPQGEFLRTVGQLKGFAVGMLIKQGRLWRTLGPTGRARYFASLAVRMVAAGAITMQLRELAKGNDVLPMDNAEFWEKAALQSGGFGVIGDLFGVVQDAVQGQRIGGLGDYFAGPVVGDAEKAIDIARTALPGFKTRQDGTRRPGNPGGAAVKALDFISPASSMWYLRAAWERMVIDQARSEMDPNDAIINAGRKRRLEQNRQGQWWANGDIAPSRAPDMENALGNPPAR